MQKHRRKRLMYREAYGYKEYGHTDEFTIFVDTDYEEGQNTKKWEE